MAKKEAVDENLKDAEGAEEGAEGAVGEPAKKSRKKIIVVGVLAIVILLGGAAGAYFGGLFGGETAHENMELGADGKPIENAVFYTLPEFLVNLNSGGKANPITSAPTSCNKKASHEPLKPVCPVTKTFLPAKEFVKNCDSINFPT